ncbi:hypothetical protein TNIN_3301 [Trichonephila inaurata madagascariensis]|uniref:Uncharacterized protein n=1 Tax=Trichonephila inaurata madagascariensis TaxID=2747483 RepID=A0A8X6YUH7_9ARAC|nr:hypothetical protein TNIN_3301 [Trichonephila inaurata madagascariensis]
MNNATAIHSQTIFEKRKLNSPPLGRRGTETRKETSNCQEKELNLQSRTSTTPSDNRRLELLRGRKRPLFEKTTTPPLLHALPLFLRNEPKLVIEEFRHAKRNPPKTFWMEASPNKRSRPEARIPKQKRTFVPERLVQ